MRIVVTGSLAYDYIMAFPGHFKEHLIAEKAATLSVSFLVDAMQKLRGGVAGNVAYTLALLGEQPLVVGAVGSDFGEYRALLESHGVDTSGIVEIADDFTSSCFINTDQDNNQIVAFYGGATGNAQDISLLGLGLTPDDLVIISPTDPVAMERYAVECQQQEIPYVFDPGKQTPRLEAAHISVGLAGAKVLISNEYEFGMMAKRLGISEEELIASVPITVVTRGDQGSRIYTDGTLTTEVPVAPVDDMRDPTGAGDAFLAGLVVGIVRGLPLDVAGRIATLAAAYTIEQHGCQEHSFTPEAFAERYQQAFGVALPTEAVAA